MRVGGRIFSVENNMKPTLYIEPVLTQALKLKIELSCPHIHFSSEENCDSFTANLLWIEVLTRSVKVATLQGSCVVSYTQKHKLKPLSDEEQGIIYNLQKKVDLMLEKINIIDNRNDF